MCLPSTAEQLRSVSAGASRSVAMVSPHRVSYNNLVCIVCSQVMGGEVGCQLPHLLFKWGKWIGIYWWICYRLVKWQIKAVLDMFLCCTSLTQMHHTPPDFRLYGVYCGPLLAMPTACFVVKVFVYMPDMMHYLDTLKWERNSCSMIQNTPGQIYSMCRCKLVPNKCLDNEKLSWISHWVRKPLQ